MQSKIITHSIEPEEFMVLVPYTKKDQQQTKQDNKTVTHLKDKNQFSDSKAADSAWSDMMHDLSFLRNITRENHRNVDSKSENSADTNEVAAVSSINWCSETKLKNRFRCDAQERNINDLIICILQSSEMAQLDQRNCKRLMQVLELVNCLSNLHSGNCMFKEAYLHGSNVNPYGNKNNLCLCPSWLKTVMKAFYFLNIYSAYLQMRCEKI